MSWLAYIPIAGGAGSWFRDNDRSKAIEQVQKIFQQDWDILIDFSKPKRVTVVVADVGDRDAGFDASRVWDQATNETIERELVPVELPAKRKRRRR